MAAAHLALYDLTAILDYNKIQQSGHVHDVLGLEPLVDKWRAFGWAGRRVERSQDLPGALAEAMARTDQPTLITLPIDYRENQLLSERLGQIACPI